MLALLGFSMLFIFMFLIMSKRLSAFTALILVPFFFALIGGFGTNIGPMMADGLQKIAPTGVMLIFGILYFSIITDTGLFEPLITRILNTIKGDPLKVTVGTAILALSVSLDGDGTTTYIIVISAMLPIYKRLGMNKLFLAAITILSSGVMNILPWGGPTARVLSALHLESSELFNPLIPAMFSSALWVIFISWYLGKKERKRLGITELEEVKTEVTDNNVPEKKNIKKPELIWFNFALTLILMILLVLNVLPLAILFMIAFSLALIVNYPTLPEQMERFSAHAGNALSVSAMVFAAGIFTGILSGTKIIDAMSEAVVSIIPNALGPHFPIITAFLTMPFTFFMTNDAYYFGVLPLFVKTASNFGITNLQMGYASLLGQSVHLLSPLVPSTYLLVGLTEINFVDLQKFALKWAFGSMIIMLITILIIKLIPF